jgi:uncharacterized membrane protein
LKIKIINGLFIIDIITIFLILAIVFIPSSIARIILGLPFLLFFPGYSLIAVLFVNKPKMDNLEILALSCGTSIAIVALIGLGLNFTIWGIKLEPVLYSIAGFICLMSMIALIRRAFSLKNDNFTMEFDINFSGLKGGILNKSLFIVLIIAVISSIGALGYTAYASKTGETYSEFYLLGLNGKAQEYPTDFIMTQGQVTGVSYDGGTTIMNGNQGKVIIGIINHEQRGTKYSIKLTVDGQPTNISYQGSNYDQLDNIELDTNQKWEQQVGFSPQHAGNNQDVQISLYTYGGTVAENTLNLWINAK